MNWPEVGFIFSPVVLANCCTLLCLGKGLRVFRILEFYKCHKIYLVCNLGDSKSQDFYPDKQFTDNITNILIWAGRKREAQNYRQKSSGTDKYGQGDGGSDPGKLSPR